MRASALGAKKKVRSAAAKSRKANKKIRSVDFRLLEIFLAVARSGGFREAARDLNTHQPLVTKCMDQLEEFLGIELFDRDRRRRLSPDERPRRLGTLTPKGQKFRAHAEQLIRMHKETIDMFRDRSVVHGIVRLGVSESIVHTWLPALLKQVTAAYPKLEIEIEVDISPKLRDLLVARELDLAFLLGPVEDPNLRSQSLCNFPVAFIASEKIALPPKPVTLQHILDRNHRIITFARETQPHMALRNQLDRLAGRATIWASASLEAVVRLTLEGLGIAVIPPDILKKKVGVRGLRRLNTDIVLPDLAYVVSWPAASDTTDNTVQKVIDMAMKVSREWTKAARGSGRYDHKKISKTA
jgi:DNA-binding transcriptional LysR family regulator